MVVDLQKAASLAIAFICAVMLSSFAMVPSAHANTGHWYFSFSKSDGVHKCGPIKKTNGKNFANISIKKSADNVFTPGKSVLGLRVRTNKGKNATNYHTYTYYTNSTNLTYLKDKAIVNHNYNLRGQVDSSSKTNLIQVWGYWIP